MRLLRNLTVLAAGLAIFAGDARAQSIDEALRLYKSSDYEDAAFAFYNVLQNDANPDHRDQAEIYLAETLRKLGLYVPALFYYSDLFKAGRKNRYYLNAVEGLLKVQAALHDPLWVPKLLDELLDPEGFGQLDPDAIAQINYLVGELSFRQRKNQDARAFLEYVPPESPLYPKARYLLGILEIRARNPEGATAHFKAVIDTIGDRGADDDLRHVRNLALLAIARNSYGLAKYEEASKFYRDVPRFSEEWFNAMYENAWANLQQDQHGKALGELQSVLAPYFSKRHVPEAYVIQGTIYFANCQWDRVRKAVDRYKKVYEPMHKGLGGYLKESRDWADWYRDVVNGGGGRFSIEIAREVRRSRRFKNYHYMLTHMNWERDKLDATSVWKGSQLAADVSAIIDDHRAGTEQVAGMWAKRRLIDLEQALANFQNQINILDFEVADAERRWLEQGKEILKGRRAILPRPEIPTDQWQHWGFKKEYWKDELGYIEHSLRSECF